MKIAIVTGASSGIGRATALQLARRGYGVVVTYNAGAALAQSLVREIESVGASVVAVHLDVGQMASLDAFVTRVRDLLRDKWDRKTFEVLVNNAGIGGGVPFVSVDEAYFDRMLAVNFKGPYFLTQKLLPLLADGAHIVNVSSGAARQAPAGYSVYGALKAATTSVTRYLAKELAARRMRVNSVSPGPVLTNIADGAFDKHPEYIAPLAASTLLGRIAQPDDVAKAIASLLSDDFGYVTATDIDVSGGFMV